MRGLAQPHQRVHKGPSCSHRALRPEHLKFCTNPWTERQVAHTTHTQWQRVQPKYTVYEENRSVPLTCLFTRCAPRHSPYVQATACRTGLQPSLCTTCNSQTCLLEKPFYFLTLHLLTPLLASPAQDLAWGAEARELPNFALSLPFLASLIHKTYPLTRILG